jgi:hypothetical protein
VKSYKELVEQAAEIEAKGQKTPVSYVGVDVGEGEPFIGKARDYAGLLAIAMRMGGRSEPAVQSAKPAVATGKPGAGHQAGAAVSENVPEAVAAPMQSGRSSIAMSAREEMKHLVKIGKAGARREEEEARFEIGNGLVLPKLSVPEQISELEKIIESIKNNYFDKYQMEIVVRELNGLADAVKSGKAETAQDSLEEELKALRNSRLSDALALLQKG